MAINCDPATLALASACYCYDQKTSDAVMIYLLAAIAGDTSTPKELAEKAKCYCFGDHQMAEAVISYLLCQNANGGSGPVGECLNVEGAGDPT